jgi:hypothetical protein
MKRQHQFLLIASTVGCSWLLMQVVHELGHMLAAWATGSRIAEVKLHPAAISYTLLAPNPQPLVVAWMGPLVGAILPLLASMIARRWKLRGWYVLQFFAGFCLVANGAYLIGGAVNNIGDAADLLRHGTPKLMIYLFAVPAILVGLCLWNGLGAYFGLGPQAKQVDSRVALVVLLLLLATITIELAFAY